MKGVKEGVREIAKTSGRRKVRSMVIQKLLLPFLPAILIAILIVGLIIFVLLAILGINIAAQSVSTSSCPPGMSVVIPGITGNQSPVLGSGPSNVVPGQGSEYGFVDSTGVWQEVGQATKLGWSGEQLVNAKIIAEVGTAMGAGQRGIEIAIMTAMGESSLRNLSYGDDIFGVKNPDGSKTSSIGLFQQQKWWEPLTVPVAGQPGYGQPLGFARLDPYYSSQKFFEGLLAVPQWDSLTPTLAAHKVQKNADPNHYQKYFSDAQTVFLALDAVTLTNVPNQLVVSGCVPNLAGFGPGLVSAMGWSAPIVGGHLSSGFGPRNTGIPGASTNHQGLDFAAACGTSVYAAAPGVVTVAGWDAAWSGLGNRIDIDHGTTTDGRKVITRYGHLLTGQLYVQAGQQVGAGQVIAGSGGNNAMDPKGAGTSSGCHLHFEVRLDGAAVDPKTWLMGLGVAL